MKNGEKVKIISLKKMLLFLYLLINFDWSIIALQLPWWLRRKNLPADAADMGYISGLARSPGEENGKRFQYF